MRKERILLLLGIWVAILPYLGFPNSWKDVLFTLTGFGLIYFAYFLYNEFKRGEAQDEIKNKTEEKIFDNFSENGNFSENNLAEIINEIDEPLSDVVEKNLK